MKEKIFQNPWIDRAMKRAREIKPVRSAAEKTDNPYLPFDYEVRLILKTHISAASGPQGKDVWPIVNSCYDKLKAGGYLKDERVPVINEPEVARALSDGTACEVE